MLTDVDRFYLTAIGIVALIVFLVLEHVIFAKRAVNPFASDTRRTPEPYVSDSAKRDAVLKQGFSVKDVPEDVDAIVIGRFDSSLSSSSSSSSSSSY